jgi:Rho GTPase-activating protein 1
VLTSNLSKYSDLMHDISLRSTSNLMDAFNLTIVLCPNLVAGSNALRDVSMCSTPGKSFSYQPAKSNGPTPSEGKTTLGMVIKLCIQRYYEVFDEARDRSEAVSQHKPTLGEGAASSEVSSVSGSLQRTREIQHEDEEDIDDAMLVMPIGPSRSHGATSTSHNDATSSPPPSSWGITPTPYKPRRRVTATGTPKVDVRSLSSENRKSHGNGNGNGGNTYVSTSRARSLISIEKAGAVGTVGRKGSISIGRGTTGKSSGAGVEAISISAEGFFSPPGSIPPVPPIPSDVLRS